MTDPLESSAGDALVRMLRKDGQQAVAEAVCKKVLLNNSQAHWAARHLG